MKSGRPVKIVYDRMEDMAATTKRHPSKNEAIAPRVSKEGKILGGEIEFTIDGGAYATLSSVVLSRVRFTREDLIFGRACAFARQGKWQRIRLPCGVSRIWRGRKACLCDGAAHGPHRRGRGNFSGRKFAEKFSESRGRPTTTEQTIREEIDLDRLLGRALELSGYAAKKTRFAEENKNGSRKKESGISGPVLHGAGFTAPVERYLNSLVGVGSRCRPARFECWCPARNWPQGTNTVLCQIAAEALGLPYESSRSRSRTRTVVPNSGPTVASRTAMIVGKVVQSAAKGIQQTLTKTGLLKEECTPEHFRAACREYIAEHGALKSLCAGMKRPAHVSWGR